MDSLYSVCSFPHKFSSFISWYLEKDFHLIIKFFFYGTISICCLGNLTTLIPLSRKLISCPGSHLIMTHLVFKRNGARKKIIFEQGDWTWMFLCLFCPTRKEGDVGELCVSPVSEQHRQLHIHDLNFWSQPSAKLLSVPFSRRGNRIINARSLGCRGTKFRRQFCLTFKHVCFHLSSSKIYEYKSLPCYEILKANNISMKHTWIMKL